MRSRYPMMLAAASMALATKPDAQDEEVSVSSVPPRPRVYESLLKGFPASINRHTGKPHEHKRAIARRLRQLAGKEL